MATEDSSTKLISLAVHELRTPVGVVGGYLRMLQRDPATPLDDRQRKMVDEAEKACVRLVALIGALGEIAKFDEGLLPLCTRTSAVVVVAEEAGVQAAYDAPAGAFDEKRGGLGLSLPFARRVIEAHGGRLWSPDLRDPGAARGAALIAFPLT